MILNESASVEVAPNQNEDIADVQFDFTPIAQLAAVETVLTVDIIGVIIADNGTREINTKNGMRKLRTFVIIDDSKLPDEDPQSITGVQVSMWGDEVDTVQLPEGDVVGIKRCRTNQYRGAVQLNVSQDDDIYPRKDLKAFKE